MEINNYDVAAALSYGELSKAAYNFARAKFCEDKIAIKWLLISFNDFVFITLKSLQLNHSPKIVKGLCELMLREAVYGAQCNPCKGMGRVHIKDEVKSCKKCTGTGSASYSQRKRAKIVGIPVTTWHRTWQKHIPDFLNYVSTLQNEVNRHIQSQFK